MSDRHAINWTPEEARRILFTDFTLRPTEENVFLPPLPVAPPSPPVEYDRDDLRALGHEFLRAWQRFDKHESEWNRDLVNEVIADMARLAGLL